MLDEKKRLSLEELEDQVAFELPERELPGLLKIWLVTGDIYVIKIKNVSVNTAVNLCNVLVVQLFVATKCIAKAG